jgi:hypothetical protein
MPKKKNIFKPFKEKLLPNYISESDVHTNNVQPSAPEIESETDIISDCCIICQEDIQPLIKNIYCACNIYWHNTCWDLYLQKTTVPKCLMCRKILDIVINKDIHHQSEQDTNSTINTNIFEEASHDLNIDYRELTNNITTHMNNVNSNLERILGGLFTNNQQPAHSVIEIPSQLNQQQNIEESNQEQEQEQEQEQLHRRNKKITEIILITSVIIGILIAILLIH